MIELFSSREIAMGIWIVIFFILIFILAVKSTSVRESIYHLIRTTTNKYIIIFFGTIIAYATIWIKLSSTLSVWDWKYLKDIIFWVLFVGVPFCFNAVTEKSESYIGNVIKSNFKFTIFLEFLIGTYTFTLVTELVLIPIATLLILFNAVAATDKSYISAEKFISFLQVVLGFSVLYFAVKSAIEHYIELNSIDHLITFSIPIIMTFLFLPLAYLYAIYAEYEILFKIMKFRVPNERKIKGRVKWRILKVCKFSKKKVYAFKSNYLAVIYTTMSEAEFDDTIERFRLSYKE
ncbi:hypothetical protein [Bacillus niameyensis]|uniref:hypothetical protein n=1 Tax=Bacillus niameyensis TaxID=1522308 RepID=UPI0007836F17|nr:hypothetical protein [Bacillus niameyensis]